ncbi:Neuroendocrine convertase 1 [Sarcoptes scabiei]|uniref:Neuroendocrine convertase 1 n=1 Tax=Sarcoptes scabiei TaxID=52283 RepID=A0A834RA56_SARSC|nr:Neuroendocrine convertase 1 [Sarcoptes scabiei]
MLSHTVDTLSVMMYPRFKDNSLHGFRNWNLTSIHFWGEDPIGIWRLYIQNVQKSMGPARLLNVELILHGITKPGGCFRKKPFRRYLDEELIQKVITKVPEYSETLPEAYNQFFETFE